MRDVRKVADATVIVPVHNEAMILDRTLRGLLGQIDRLADDTASPTRCVRIIVACNGCTDASADVARGIDPRVEVIEIAEASKAAALNQANRIAAGHRLFVDADVTLSASALADVLDLLDRDDVDAAAPRPVLTADRPSLFTRWYLDVWRRAPYWGAGLIGGGFYAIAGRAADRLGDFPPIIADDLFVLSAIPPGRRATTTASTFTHPVPDTLRAIHRQEARRLAGRDQFLEWSRVHLTTVDPVVGDRRWLRDVLTQPGLAPKGVLYLAVRWTAHRWGRAALRRGSLRWGTTR